jgi:hypothetical protein
MWTNRERRVVLESGVESVADGELYGLLVEIVLKDDELQAKYLQSLEDPQYDACELTPVLRAEALVRMPAKICICWVDVT